MKKKGFLTPATMRKIKIKSRYFQLFKDGFLTKQENNRLKNQLNKDIKRDKRNHYHNLFKNAKSDMRRSWNIIGSLLGTKIKKNDAELIFDNAITGTDRVDKVNQFNDFFTSIGHRLSAEIPSTGTSPTAHIPPNPHSFFLFEPTATEISIIVSNLKISKTHIDEIPVKIFKKLSVVLSRPLIKLISTSFHLGLFPESLKIARITPIHKDGDHATPSNFRPISCLPYISKIYEKLMAKRLFSFNRKFSIITPTQFGFQPGISTSDALIKISELIYQSLDNKNHHISILLDIKKAFDCVDHTILLAKLERYGIRGIPLQWFKSYLSNRKCFTEIISIKSNMQTFNVGVPQGSILGPLLFLMYVNDLPLTSDLLHTQLFADDTIVSNYGHDLQDLIASTDTELDKIMNWTLTNKLTLNARKTELLLISNRTNNFDSHMISLGNETIHPCTSCKYLGVHIDRNMTFTHHIDHVLKKISRHTGILYKIRDPLTQQARLNYYYAFIYPYLSYNVILWGSTFQTHLNPLIVQHKRTIRTIADANFRDHTDPLFRRLGLLKFADIYLYHILVYMFKAIKRGEYTQTRNLNTRSTGLAQPVFHRLTTTQHAISFTGPTAWNNLPNQMRSIEKIGTFKRTLKAYLISNYHIEEN